MVKLNDLQIIKVKQHYQKRGRKCPTYTLLTKQFHFDYLNSPVQSSAGQSSAGQSSAGQSSAGQSSAGQSYADNELRNATNFLLTMEVGNYFERHLAVPL